MNLQLGDVPSWLSATIAGAALWRSMIGCRREWLIDFATIVDQLSKLEPGEIASTIEGNSRVAEIVGTAWEAAARSGDEAKRKLLGKVAAAALRETDGAKLDELQFFTRTLRDVEAGHVGLLATMVRVGGGTGKKIKRPDIDAAWPQAGELLSPMLQLLSREGLIEDASNTYEGISFTGVQEWQVTAYGGSFLRFLDS